MTGWARAEGSTARPLPWRRRLKHGLLRVLGNTAWRVWGIAVSSHPGARALDVGCGQGFFVRALRDLGWRGWGVEIAPERVAYATQVTPHLVQGDARALPYGPGTFRALFFWHVLEHLPDPYRALVEARRVLERGGILLVEVPNLASVQATVFGDRWFHLAFDVHFWHFTPKTLRMLLARAGFVDVQVWSGFNSVGWVRSWRRGNGWAPFFLIAEMGLALVNKGGVLRAMARS